MSDSTAPQTSRHADPAYPSIGRRILIPIAVLIGGVLAWLVAGWRGETVQHWIALGVTAAICMVAPIRRAIAAKFDGIRHLNSRQLFIAMASVFVVICTYLFATAWW